MRISEIFGPTIQGEGATIGTPTVFVRTGGCDYRCSWCDTPHAVLPEHRKEWESMLPAEVMFHVVALSKGQPLLITLSGGNPAIQPYQEMVDLIRLAHNQDYTVTMETQGSVPRGWMRQLDFLTVSPKPPSSGMPTDWGILDEVLTIGPAGATSLKVVVMRSDEDPEIELADLDYAQRIYEKYDGTYPIFFQVGNAEYRPDDVPDRDVLLSTLEWLYERVIERELLNARVLPQLHTLLWGNTKGV